MLLMTDTTSAWDRYPGYEIALVPLRGVGRVRVGDTVVAESTRCLIVRESEHREQLYFPRNDIVSGFLVNSDHHTTCPFKGEASYADVCVGRTIVENAMWWYPT